MIGRPGIYVPKQILISLNPDPYDFPYRGLQDQDHGLSINLERQIVNPMTAVEEDSSPLS